jgi:hypothetical protein
VHRLVLEAFVCPCPEGRECCHNDGDPANNALTNLRWNTRKANIEDSRRHGIKPIGSRANAKLREDDVHESRRLKTEGCPWTGSPPPSGSGANIEARSAIADPGARWGSLRYVGDLLAVNR